MQWVIPKPEYGRSPEICINREGEGQIAWISSTPSGECILLTSLDNLKNEQTPRRCTDFCRFITSFAITPFDNGILLAWIGGDKKGRESLKIKLISPEDNGSAVTVAPSLVKPAYPALASNGTDFALVWTVLEGKRRHIVMSRRNALDGTGESITIPGTLGTMLCPKISPSGEGFLVVWQEMSRKNAAIFACHINTQESALTPIPIAKGERSIPANPTVCQDGSAGHWIAWQSDLDPEEGPGLVRWIDIAHLSPDGAIRQPASPMPNIDRQSQGEDQGFESPSIASLDDGRLVVIGRGSQSVQRQDLGENGWTQRHQFDEPGWQCRGRRYAICPHADGIYVVGRERAGIAVRLLETEQGDCSGHPLLAPRPASDSAPPEKGDKETEHHIFAGFRVLFGDIHQHTIASDGTGTPEECYQRARGRYRDDLVAIADHESFLGKTTPQGEWLEHCRIADEFQDSGTFITLHAYEWTSKMFPGPGHKVVYLPEGGGPLLSRDDPSSKTSKGLRSECRTIGAVAVPHHVGWTGADMENHYPSYQPCWEIVSCHGVYEKQGEGPIGTRGDDKEGQFISDALDSNLRFGFAGGSDGHGLNWHHGVSRKKDSHRTGLTAFFCHEVTRAAVLEALKRRRCYATSGAKIGLWFEIDGRPMGEELIASSSVRFRIVVSATDPIETLELITNGHEKTPLEASGRNVSIHGTLPPPAEDGYSYYYVRVLQKDGEMAWSSPIWLDAPGPA